ncbi:hypothetical protein SF23_15355, partial [Streptomyces sp. MBRL 10]
MTNFPVPHDPKEPILPTSPQHPGTPPEYTPATWDSVCRRLLAKMLAEFAYEEIVTPVPAPAFAGDAWTLTLDDGSSLGFRARRRAYGSWHVVPESITLTPPTTPRPTPYPPAPSTT